MTKDTAQDWAIRVTDDTIEVADGAAVYTDGRGSYIVVRDGLQESWLQGPSPNLQRLLDSVAEFVPVLPPPGVRARLPNVLAHSSQVIRGNTIHRPKLG